MDTDQNRSPRVLSIQSHVVSGYVGNKSATFPLQINGFEVDAINTVQFSNHTGYGIFKGQIIDSSDLCTLFDGLKANGLLDNYTHILTGYARSLSLLEEVYKVVLEVKQRNPGAIYVCDPVMGDGGQMYVPEEVLPFYRDHLIKLADVLTPNQFEAEVLTGIKINNMDDAIAAIDVLHGKGVPIVVISSSDFGADESNIVTIASQSNGTKNGTKNGANGDSVHGGHKIRYKISMPKLPVTFVGTGDLFCALLLTWLHKTDSNLQLSLEKVMSTMAAILDRTYQSAKIDPRGLTSASLELKLIQSQSDLKSPKIVYKCDSIDL